VITLIQGSTAEDDVLWKQALKALTFKEIPDVGLGYSKNRPSGSAIGPGLARELLRTANAIIKAGTKDEKIFEVASLLNDDIGPDRISDMTLSILLPNILNFTQRVANNLCVPTKTYYARGASYEVPFQQQSGKPLLLVPADILRDIPVSK